MKRTLKLRIMSLALVSAAFVPAAQAFDFEVGGIYYNLNNTSVSVTFSDLQGTYSGNVVIPAQVTYRMQTYPVKGIDNLAFINSTEMTSVKLPDAITYIGDQAFSHCSSLTEITLPAKLQRIADFAFEYCENLSTLTIPASVTQIGYASFMYCRALTEIQVAEENPVYTADNGILYSKDLRLLVHYPASKPDTEFTMPESVQIVPDGAFSPQYHLQTININAALSAVTDGLFAECARLGCINVSPDNQNLASVDGALYDKKLTKLLQFPLFHESSYLALPETVTSLADLSLLGASYLHELEIPAALTDIGTFALAGCIGISSVICHAPTPPVSTPNPLNPSGEIFEPAVFAQASLQVPAESLDAYKADAQWGRFSSIYEIGGSALDAVDAPEAAAPTVTYDLHGRIIPPGTPRRGFRIEVMPDGHSRLVR